MVDNGRGQNTCLQHVGEALMRILLLSAMEVKVQQQRLIGSRLPRRIQHNNQA